MPFRNSASSLDSSINSRKPILLKVFLQLPKPFDLGMGFIVYSVFKELSVKVVSSTDMSEVYQSLYALQAGKSEKTKKFFTTLTLLSAQTTPMRL
jgi:hypothetical protein